MNDEIFKAEESIYGLWWEGPYTLDELHSHATSNEMTPSAWTIYSIYSDHPLYGHNVLTYVGKSLDVLGRLKNHNNEWWHGGVVRVASIYKFTTWKKYYNDSYADAIIPSRQGKYNDNNGQIVSRVEELLILGLSPAYNNKNKSTANKSYDYRIFNYGSVGTVPREVSSRFWIENVPENSEQE